MRRQPNECAVMNTKTHTPNRKWIDGNALRRAHNIIIIIRRLKYKMYITRAKSDEIKFLHRCVAMVRHYRLSYVRWVFFRFSFFVSMFIFMFYSTWPFSTRLNLFIFFLLLLLLLTACYFCCLCTPFWFLLILNIIGERMHFVVCMSECEQASALLRFVSAFGFELTATSTHGKKNEKINNAGNKGMNNKIMQKKILWTNKLKFNIFRVAKCRVRLRSISAFRCGAALLACFFSSLSLSPSLYLL